MRVLLPDPVDEVDVHASYADSWLDTGGIRANFVCAADGAAQANDKSADLQTPGDNKIFAALRDLADVVLAGAGTAVAEGYAPIDLSARRTAIRRDYGLAARLPTAVTSRSLRLDPRSALFAAAPTENRTIVLTCAAAPADRRAAMERVADVVNCGDETVEPVAIRAALADRGLTRVLSEGGPTAFAELVRAGVVDELCLSMSPLLIGPGPGRITGGDRAWPNAEGLRLVSLLEENGALFLRYRFQPRD